MAHITDLVYYHEGRWIPTDKLSLWARQWLTQQQADALLLSLESMRLFRLAETALVMPPEPTQDPYQEWHV